MPLASVFTVTSLDLAGAGGNALEVLGVAEQHLHLGALGCTLEVAGDGERSAPLHDRGQAGLGQRRRRRLRRRRRRIGHRDRQDHGGRVGRGVDHDLEITGLDRAVAEDGGRFDLAVLDQALTDDLAVLEQQVVGQGLVQDGKVEVPASSATARSSPVISRP